MRTMLQNSAALIFNNLKRVQGSQAVKQTLDEIRNTLYNSLQVVVSSSAGKNDGAEA